MPWRDQGRRDIEAERLRGLQVGRTVRIDEFSASASGRHAIVNANSAARCGRYRRLDLSANRDEILADLITRI